ncbi:MAG: NAD(P)-dependent glycerol-3-phosphate dehydrogenase [Betaproteobacteria bacterium]|nr:NAD(P)-dependent glycerol-3-phosphate dehydrogenase [Betaproteobacteria bacterium]
MKLAVLGAGAWGTALATSFSREHTVMLWARDAAQAAAIRQSRVNQRYLPGLPLPEAVAVTAALDDAISAADLIVLVTSTAGMAPVLSSLRGLDARIPLLWACKGFEVSTGRLPHQIADALLPADVSRGALSGPSFAQEVAQGKPAALTLASVDAHFASRAAADLNSTSLRVYSSTDLIGVELGGALKNVIAIAAGVSDGLDLGNNARAALVTRGLSEISRLGMALGGRPDTFMGLTGLGDLILTATGDLSRNRTVGRRLAAGQSLDAILADLGHVAEGVNSARAALRLAREHHCDMPITEAVCGLLFDGLSPKVAVRQLMAREPKPEAR